MYHSSVFSDADGKETSYPEKQAKIIVSLFSIDAGLLTGEPIVFTPDTPMALTVGVDAPKDQQWTSYQTMISLPAGLSVATDEDGNAICQLSERHDGNFSVSVRKQDDGRYLLLCHSADSKPVTGLEGPLFTLALKADSTTLDGWEVKLTDAIFSDKQGHEVWLEDYNVQIRTPKPIITINNLTREYGEQNPTLTYTVSGTLDFEPVLTTTATASSPVDTYPITLQPPSGEVEEYEVVNGTLTVTQAPLTIKANDATIAQGDEIPALSVSYEGWKLGETATVLTQQPVVHCDAVQGSAPGSYPITVDSAEAQNYAISYEPGTLTVTEAPRIDITAQSITVEYGEPIPALTYTSEGAAIIGEPALSCEATQGSPVGTYDIVIEKGAVANYNDHYENGTLTITAAPLHIAVDGEYSRKMGEANPDFVLSYEGWKLDEDESVLTQQPVVTCEADETSEPGEYPIIVSGAEAQNYDISYQNGVLVVTDSTTLVLTAESYTVEYGEPLPAFAFTATGPAYSGTPVLSCEAAQGSPVGVYDIVIAKGSVECENELALVNGTLTITAAPLLISVGNYTKRQGDEMPAFELTYDGFKLDEDNSVLTEQPTIHCEATAVSEPGEYPITIDGAEAQNYDISYQPGTLTVLEALPIYVTAKDITVEYGEPIPALTYTTEGAAIIGTPDISCEAVLGSPVGTYDIVISKGSVANFNDHYENGTLTIVPAPLTIIANDAEITEGDELPELTVRYEGFKLDETEAVLTQQPTLHCEATAESEPGEYPITVEGAEAQNYVITYVPGTLTIQSLHRVWLTIGVVGNGSAFYEGTEVANSLHSEEVSTTREVNIMMVAMNGQHLEWLRVGETDYPLDQLERRGEEYLLTLGTLETDTDVMACFQADVIEPDSVVIALEIDGLGNVYVGREGPFDEEVQYIKVPKYINVLMEFLPERELNEPQVLGKLMVDDEMVTQDVLHDLYILYYMEADTTHVHAIFREDIETFTVDGITYGVRDYDASRVTVMMPERTVPNYAGELNVPEQVAYHGITWNVKEVAKYTFFDCPELLSVSIPSSVETSADRILKACPRLGAIEWLASVPLTTTMMTSYRNPNMLYYTTDASMVPGYAQNIVIDGRAQHIELIDARGRCDFYCPKAFTADEILYRHNYLQATEIKGKQGWDALVLPFDVQEITHEGGANIDAKGDIHPFKVLSEEEIDNGARPFWLYHFSADGFISAAGIEANVPYIIAMPNNSRYEAEYLIAGTVKFTATNAEVKPTREAVPVEAADRAFCPTFSAIELGEYNCYLLNVGDEYNGHAEGSVFARYRRDGHPFEAYFRMKDGSGVKEFISVFEEMQDGIESITPDLSLAKRGEVGAVYDLAGRKIINHQSSDHKLLQGIYIKDGKKVVVK